jgi:hypothetical protein
MVIPVRHQQLPVRTTSKKPSPCNPCSRYDVLFWDSFDKKIRAVDILLIDVLEGFAPAAVASPSGDISGKCSSGTPPEEVSYRDATKLKIFNFRRSQRLVDI